MWDQVFAGSGAGPCASCSPVGVDQAVGTARGRVRHHRVGEPAALLLGEHGAPGVVRRGRDRPTPRSSCRWSGRGRSASATVTQSLTPSKLRRVRTSRAGRPRGAGDRAGVPEPGLVRGRGARVLLEAVGGDQPRAARRVVDGDGHRRRGRLVAGRVDRDRRERVRRVRGAARVPAEARRAPWCPARRGSRRRA